MPWDVIWLRHHHQAPSLLPPPPRDSLPTRKQGRCAAGTSSGHQRNWAFLASLSFSLLQSFQSTPKGCVLAWWWNRQLEWHIICPSQNWGCLSHSLSLYLTVFLLFLLFFLSSLALFISFSLCLSLPPSYSLTRITMTFWKTMFVNCFKLPLSCTEITSRTQLAHTNYEHCLSSEGSWNGTCFKRGTVYLHCDVVLRHSDKRKVLAFETERKLYVRSLEGFRVDQAQLKHLSQMCSDRVRHI